MKGKLFNFRTQIKQANLKKVSILVILIALFIMSSLVIAQNSTRKNPLANKDSIKDALVLQNAMRLIYKTVNPAVVRIETEDTIQQRANPFFNDPMFRFFFGVPNQRGRKNPKQKKQGLGSGFIISKDGYIVTNHHVVISHQNSKNYVEKVKVKLINGNSYEAKVIGSDPASDIAVLKIKAKEKMNVVFIGDSDKIEVGDFAIAIGNPFGLSSTFTMGVISSKGQDIESQDGIPRIQTDAPINPGNSGGPLLNIRGEVIGINQLIYSQSGGSVGIGFAIPINYAMGVIQKLKAGKKIKHGYIGVSIIPEPTKKQLEELGLNDKKGLLVHSVELGSPAFKAGIVAYDYITKIDSKPASKFSDLKTAVLRKKIGDKITLQIIRRNTYKTIKVKVNEKNN